MDPHIWPSKSRTTIETGLILRQSDDIPLDQVSDSTSAINIYVSNFVCFALSYTEVLDLLEELCLTRVATVIFITKACHMIKLNLLTSLSVDICFIYYTASFSVDSVSEQNMPSPCVVSKCKGNYTNSPRVHCFSFPKS